MEHIRIFETFHERLLARYVNAHARLRDVPAQRFESTHLRVIEDPVDIESRVFGFRDTLVPLAEIERAVQWLRRDYDQKHRVELSPLAHPEQEAMVATRARHLFSTVVLARFLKENLPEKEGLAEVRWATPESPPEDLDLIVDGIAHAFADGFVTAAGPRMGRAYALLGEHVGAFDGETFMAGAGLFLGGSVAYLSGMGVLPTFRGRHLQSELIAARCQRALEKGASLVFATDAPGHLSQRNLQRAGFTPVYERRSYFWNE